MKHFIAVLLCAFVACTLAAPPLEEGRQRVANAHKQCQTNPATQADRAQVQAYYKGQGEVPDNWGPHSLCISKSLGWQNEDGSINVELLRNRISGVFTDAAKVDAIITECSVNQATPEATAVFLGGCYRKYAAPPAQPAH